MIISDLVLEKCVYSSSGGVNYVYHNPVVLEGQDMHVKFMTSETAIFVSTHESFMEEKIAYSPYLIPITAFSNLPQDLYLAKGEKLYLANLNQYSKANIMIIHYNKTPNSKSDSKSFSLNLTGDISPKAL